MKRLDSSGVGGTFETPAFLTLIHVQSNTRFILSSSRQVKKHTNSQIQNGHMSRLQTCTRTQI